jgi:hypothetical protein
MGGRRYMGKEVGRYMGGTWEVHGRYMGGTWEVHGRYMGDTGKGR